MMMESENRVLPLKMTYVFSSFILFNITISCYGVLADDNVCFLYESKMFGGSPLLSLQSSVKVFETRLIFHLASEKGIDIQSVKVAKSNCSVILCSEKNLLGQCTEYTASISDVTSQKNNRNVKSVDCHCSEVTQDTSETFIPIVILPEKVQNIKTLDETPCANVYRDWHFHGEQHQLTFSGTTLKIATDRIRSISVKHGCTLNLWGYNSNSSRKETVSFALSNSTSFLEMKPVENFHWACCHCDQCSENVCQHAQSSSENFHSSASPDFSQFIKHSKKIIGIGRNYRWKKVEVAKYLEVPKEPIVFLKPTTSYISEGQTIELPESLGTIFYELEMGVVIGKKGKHILESKAMDYVAGYFLALDMTAKQFLKRSSNQSLPWEIGKGYDTACPVGGFIPKSLINDPNNVHLECILNGEVTQSENTSEMIFNVQQLISYVSKFMTLEPYDVILTGTPDGFGALKAGDVIEGRMGNVTSIHFTATNV